MKLISLTKTEVGWQTATFPPLSPGSALRRFQWHAEDQLHGEWGLPDRGLESWPDQNEMNIQSEAKPHGLICPFTTPVIILRVSSAAPPPRWEGSLAEAESSSFGCRKKKSLEKWGLRENGKERRKKLAAASHKRNTWKSSRSGVAVVLKRVGGQRVSGGSLEVSTLARIIDSNTRRVRFHAGGHEE